MMTTVRKYIKELKISKMVKTSSNSLNSIWSEMDTLEKTAAITWIVGIIGGFFSSEIRHLGFAWTAGVGLGTILTSAYLRSKLDIDAYIIKKEKNER